MQQRVHAEEFSDGPLHQLAELYWTHQRDEGEPTLAEFVSLLDTELKQLAILLVEEVESLADADQTLAEAIKHLDDERKRKEEAKLVAELRRTTEPTEAGKIDEVDLLRQLQEKARRPDLRRV